MKTLRYGKVWLGLGWLMLLASFLAMVAPSIPFEGASNIDKVQHVVCFLVLTVWFCGLQDRRRCWAIGGWLLAYGVGTEVVQGFLSYRTASLGDLAADSLGVAVGLGLALTGADRWCVFLERKLLS
jgi:VanZ family protein